MQINHVPGVEQLSRKKMLAKAFSELVSSPYRSHFAIYPRSWTLMSDYEDLVKSMRHQRAKEHKLSVAYNAALQAYQQAKASQPNADITPPVPPPSPMTYIVKPGSACQGKGISLVMSPEKVKRVVGNVVQEYIANPLLIRGKKFDLRIYVLITSVAPLRMYVFQDGLARFCTEVSSLIRPFIRTPTLFSIPLCSDFSCNLLYLASITYLSSFLPYPSINLYLIGLYSSSSR